MYSCYIIPAGLPHQINDLQTLFFGEWEERINTEYGSLWLIDTHTPTSKLFTVEWLIIRKHVLAKQEEYDFSWPPNHWQTGMKKMRLYNMCWESAVRDYIAGLNRSTQAQKRALKICGFSHKIQRSVLSSSLPSFIVRFLLSLFCYLKLYYCWKKPRQTDPLVVR